MLLIVLRAAFLALLIGVSLLAFNLFEDMHTGRAGSGFWPAMAAGGAVVTAGVLVLFVDVRAGQKQITIISAVFFGLLLGMLLAWLVATALKPVIEAAFTDLNPKQLAKLEVLNRMFLVVMSCYVVISTFLQTKDDFRFVIPYVEFARQVRGGRPLVLDTSVIIDGRIADLCDTRIIDSKLVVPRFVLQELQAVSDSTDKLKRNRGRRGLDILKRLQTNQRIELVMHDGSGVELQPGEKIRVDERLVLFTKAINGRVVTNDFNLNKIAQLQGVDVINLNEVANSLKTVALPGEYLMVRIMKAGDQIGQGVGYLDDGTMVVVESGKPHIGTEVSILVTSVLQTPAGRMIFGRPEAKPSGAFQPVSNSASSASYTPVPPAIDGKKPEASGPKLPPPKV
ncbi:MAG: PIN/TRAM domain-containing protein [Fimbriiglobus sp.]